MIGADRSRLHSLSEHSPAERRNSFDAKRRAATRGDGFDGVAGTASCVLEQVAGLSSVTVAVEPVTGEIVGFYSLSPLSIRVDEAVRKVVGMETVPNPSIGGYLLGRSGVAAAHQGKDYGTLLVERAIDAARRAQSATGGVFLAVDPKNAKLLTWCLRLGFGFVRLDEKRSRLVMRL